MSKEKIFKDLIASMAKDGEISSSEYAILTEKGKDLGIDTETVDLLIKLELSEHSDRKFSAGNDSDIEEDMKAGSHVFRSAITRGGAILTPDVIVIDNETLTYRKRNRYLINVDTTTIPISKISSVKVDTSLLGTNIIIKSYGQGEIIVRRFTKSDAKKIKKLIEERQRAW
jgi:hypothetical protein